MGGGVWACYWLRGWSVRRARCVIGIVVAVSLRSSSQAYALYLEQRFEAARAIAVSDPAANKPGRQESAPKLRFVGREYLVIRLAAWR